MKPNTLTIPLQERRFISASVELRASQETDAKKGATIFGYAARFNVESENLGNGEYQFREVISPGAFDDVLGDDVRALFNHDSSMILARSKNGEGSLKIGVDENGLFYEFEMPDTQAGRDLATSIQRGDVDQSSFGFQIADGGDKWEETRVGDKSIIKRTITKVGRLLDVSPVTFPAYPDASVAIRSLTEFQKAQETPEPIEDHSLSHWQRRAGLLDKPAENKNK